jgi:ATP-dependent helicase YprA (DUF1998 family)
MQAALGELFAAEKRSRSAAAVGKTKKQKQKQKREEVPDASVPLAKCPARMDQARAGNPGKRPRDDALAAALLACQRLGNDDTAAPEPKKKKKKKKKQKIQASISAPAVAADGPPVTEPPVTDAKRKSPRLAAQAGKDLPSFDLDEDVTGTAARGAASAIVDDQATGTPLAEFDMLPDTMDILRKRGIELLFPIQTATYSKVLEGRDMIGRAKTGQGKTLAFVLPVVQTLLSRNRVGDDGGVGRAPRVLALAPTRELAKQVCVEFEIMAPTLACLCIYGGAMYGPQEGSFSSPQMFFSTAFIRRVT